MCTPQQLAAAATKMLGKNKVNRHDAQRVARIAQQMAHGQATPQEIAWAKKQASFFLPRGHRQP